MTGVIAAVATPVGADGGLIVATFERLVGFLIESGVDGLCLGGATSEYPNTALEDRKAAIGAAARHLPLDRTLLVAIGASSLRQSLELGESARDAGSRAVLLPMPMFFRYAQHDLEAFSIEVSRTLRRPGPSLRPARFYESPGARHGHPVVAERGVDCRYQGQQRDSRESRVLCDGPRQSRLDAARGQRSVASDRVEGRLERNRVGNRRILSRTAARDSSELDARGHQPGCASADVAGRSRASARHASHSLGDSHRARGARIRHGAAPAASQSSSARTGRAISHMAAGLDGSRRLRGQRLRRRRLQCAGSDGGTQQGTAT